MSIKKLNATDPGVKRPVRCSDFQDIWSGLYEALASGTFGSTTPQIITGLTIDSEHDYVLTSGLLAYNGMLYYFDSKEATINEGDPIYAGYIADADRNFSDGSVKPFSYSYVLRNTNTGLTDVYLIGQCTIANIAAWRISGVPDNSIPSEKLGQVAITKVAPETFRLSTKTADTCKRGEVLLISPPPADQYNVSITFDDANFGAFKVIIMALSDGRARFYSTRQGGPESATAISDIEIKAGTSYEIEYIMSQPRNYLLTRKEGLVITSYTD